MDTTASQQEILRFGVFEADFRNGELRKSGVKVKVQELPFRALKLLTARPGEILSRSDLRQNLWPEDVFVDFDHGISSLINRLRYVLGDSSDNPIFIETVERKGYRWIAPVHAGVIQPVAISAVRVEQAAVVPPAVVKPGESHPVRTVVLAILAAVFFMWILAPSFWPGAATQPTVPVRQHASVKPDPQAEEFYLKGRYYWNKRTEADLRQAIDLFTQAIVHDPSFAQAYVGLAECYDLMREYSSMSSLEAYPRAYAAASKAVELDDSSSEAHASLAFASFYGNWDTETAEKEFRRALELDPKNAVAHHWYATFLSLHRRFNESLAEINAAQGLDPSSKAILADKGLILIGSGRAEEGATLLKQMENAEPLFLSPHRYLSFLYLDRGDAEHYLEELRKQGDILHDSAKLAQARAGEKGVAGGMDGVITAMIPTKEKLYSAGKISAYDLAQSYAMINNRDKSIALLQTALNDHAELMPGLFWDPTFVKFHSDPAFEQVVTRVRSYPEEARKAH